MLCPNTLSNAEPVFEYESARDPIAQAKTFQNMIFELIFDLNADLESIYNMLQFADFGSLWSSANVSECARLIHRDNVAPPDVGKHRPVSVGC